MTDEMKKRLKSAKTAEEAKKILAEYAGELTEEELEAIAGGVYDPFGVCLCVKYSPKP